VRKVLSISLEVIAGAFLYMTCVVAFINVLPISVKMVMMVGASVVSGGALYAGLALTRFRHWRQHVGIVFLSAASVTLFVALSIGYILMTEEFQRLVGQGSFNFLSDYLSGGMTVVGVGVLGWTLLKQSEKEARVGTSLEQDSGVSP